MQALLLCIRIKRSGLVTYFISLFIPPGIFSIAIMKETHFQDEWPRINVDYLYVSVFFPSLRTRWLQSKQKNFRSNILLEVNVRREVVKSILPLPLRSATIKQRIKVYDCCKGITEKPKALVLKNDPSQ